MLGRIIASKAGSRDPTSSETVAATSIAYLSEPRQTALACKRVCICPRDLARNVQPPESVVGTGDDAALPSPPLQILLQLLASQPEPLEPC